MEMKRFSHTCHQSMSVCVGENAINQEHGCFIRAVFFQEKKMSLIINILIVPMFRAL